MATEVMANPAASRAPGHVGVVVGAAVTMLVVGLWGLDRGSMWQDESATFDVAHRSTAQILAMVRQVDVVHALYYLFMHVWMLPGGGEVWMRVPSVLASAVSAAVVAALAVRLGSTMAGVAAAGVFVASPLMSFYAQEGRSFALVTATVLCATYCLVRILGGGSRRWWIGYALLMATAAVLHEFSVLAVAPHGVTLLLARVGRRAWLTWLAIGTACAVLVAPLAVLSQRQSDQVSWLSAPTPSTLTELAGQLFGTPAWVAVLVIALAAGGIVADVRTRHDGTGLSISAVALPLLTVPFVILLGVSLVQPLYHIRYVLFAASGVSLLAGRGVQQVAVVLARAASPRRGIAWGFVAIVVAAIVVGQVPAQREERTVLSRSNDLAAASSAVAAHARDGDAVIFLPLRFRAAALAYPADFTKVTDIALDQTPEEARNLRGIDHSRRDVRSAMLAEQRIWVVGRSGLEVAGDEIGAVNVKDVLSSSFVKRETYDVHGMEVALFVRKST